YRLFLFHPHKGQQTSSCLPTTERSRWLRRGRHLDSKDFSRCRALFSWLHISRLEHSNFSKRFVHSAQPTLLVLLSPLYDEHFVHHRDSSCRIYYVESGAIVSALSDLEPNTHIFARTYPCGSLANNGPIGTFEILSSLLAQNCPSLLQAPPHMRKI
ncbi:hypothetical protein LZ30DRAFT_61108, partial [Colletotrichum cereale]